MSQGHTWNTAELTSLEGKKKKRKVQRKENLIALNDTMPLSWCPSLLGTASTQRMGRDLLSLLLVPRLGGSLSIHQSEVVFVLGGQTSPRGSVLTLRWARPPSATSLPTYKMFPTLVSGCSTLPQPSEFRKSVRLGELEQTSFFSQRPRRVGYQNF